MRVIGLIALSLAALGLVACEGDMGGAEEQVQDQPSEGWMDDANRSGQRTTAGGGTGAQTEGTSAQGDRLGP